MRAAVLREVSPRVKKGFDVGYRPEKFGQISNGRIELRSAFCKAVFKDKVKPLSRKIFGIGLQRTGTTSLGRALALLGFNHCGFQAELVNHYRQGDMAKVIAATEQYDSFEDWPWPLIYQQLHDIYPDALFVLTTRASEDRWFESMVKHAKFVAQKRAIANDGDLNARGRKSFRAEVYGYDNPEDNRGHHIDFYRSHCRAVRDYFSDKPASLIEVCWEHGDGWSELCAGLGVPVPQKHDFPHVNASREK